VNQLYQIYERKSIKNNQIGISKKIEIIKKNKETGLYEKGIFKEKMHLGSKDNVIEAVVYRIAKLVNVPCARAVVIQHGGSIGSFSKYEVDTLDGFIHLQEYFGHSEMFVEDFFQAIKQIKCNNVKQIYARAYQYVLLDYLVGQQDRHMENLAFVGNRDKLIFYPLYDNGLALYGNKSNSVYKEYISSGRFESRMGSSEDIYRTLKNIKATFSGVSINKIIKLEFINRKVINDIIKEEDRYNEIIAERRKDMTDFIIRKKEELMQL